MRRLILHIGWPKTGTTSIQHALSQYSGDAYYVPAELNRNHNHRLALAFGTGPKSLEELQQRNYNGRSELREIVFREIVENVPEKPVVISSERLALLPEQDIREMADFFSAHDISTEIIVSLRKQDELVASMWATMILNGREKTIEQTFFDRHTMLDYERNLNIWKHYFDNIKIIIYDKNIFKNFFDCLKIDFDDLVKSRHFNVTLSHIELLFASHAQSLHRSIYGPSSRITSPQLIQLCQNSPYEGKPRVTRQMAEFIAGVYNSSNARICAQLGLNEESLLIDPDLYDDDQSLIKKISEEQINWFFERARKQKTFFHLISER